MSSLPILACSATSAYVTWTQMLVSQTGRSKFQTQLHHEKLTCFCLKILVKCPYHVNVEDLSRVLEIKEYE